MKRLVDLAMLDRLDCLTRRQATGPPEILADRLGISLSTLHEYIMYMQITLKAPIRYNKYVQSYVYDYLPDFHLGFEKDWSQPQV